MTPRLVVPESFRPERWIGVCQTEREVLDCCWLANCLVRKAINSKDLRNGGYAELNKRTLDSVMNWRTSTRLIDGMIAAGAIVRRNRYEVGKFSRGYRLGSVYRSDRSRWIEPSDKKFIRQVLKFITESHRINQERFRASHVLLDKCKSRIDICPNCASQVLSKLSTKDNQFDNQRIQVEDILRGHFSFSLAPSGRVFNPITSLKRELRGCLSCEGEPLLGLDIVNSQPAFLAQMIYSEIRDYENRNNIKNNVIVHRDRILPSLETIHDPRTQVFDWSKSEDRQDGLAFAHVAQNGWVYDELLGYINHVELAGLSWMDRDPGKHRFLVDVLAWCSQGYQYASLVYEAFRKLHPAVCRYIDSFNSSDPSALIRHLQSVEAKFVIETVCPAIFSKHPSIFLMTLHDSIYAKKSDILKLRQGFSDAMRTVGFNFGLKIAA